MDEELSARDKSNLDAQGYLLRPLANNGAPKALYHNPANNQEFRLPADAYHMQRYLHRGFRLGPAPGEYVAPEPQATIPKPESAIAFLEAELKALKEKLELQTAGGSSESEPKLDVSQPPAKILALRKE